MRQIQKNNHSQQIRNLCQVLPVIVVALGTSAPIFAIVLWKSLFEDYFSTDLDLSTMLNQISIATFLIALVCMRLFAQFFSTKLTSSLPITNVEQLLVQIKKLTVYIFISCAFAEAILLVSFSLAFTTKDPSWFIGAGLAYLMFIAKQFLKSLEFREQAKQKLTHFHQ